MLQPSKLVMFHKPSGRWTFPFGIPFRRITLLVGGFNPSEKYKSNWESYPNRGEHIFFLKPPPRLYINMCLFLGYPFSCQDCQAFNTWICPPKWMLCGKVLRKDPGTLLLKNVFNRESVKAMVLEKYSSQEYFAGLMTGPTPRMHQLKTRCILRGPDSNQSFPLASISSKCLGNVQHIFPFMVISWWWIPW